MRVLLAFSGGIDSCAAVELLRREGWDVELLTINMLDGEDSSVEQATLEAARLGAPLHIVDGRERFRREVVDDFVGEYLAGRTPAPCTRCNSTIKWELLVAKADELGIYHIATGHYMRIVEHDSRLYVARALDSVKDQSYYLWGVEPEILKRVVTPMAEVLKSDVKAHSGGRRESMGICFLRGEHYADFINRESSGSSNPGTVVTRTGEVVGEHSGVIRYTIGQMRGVGIPHGKRVVAINSLRNEIVVDDNSTLFVRSLDIDSCRFTDVDEIANSQSITVMVRGLGLNPKGYAAVTIDNNRAHIELSDDAWAVAPGQPVVLYIGNRVVGGGYTI